MLSEENEMTARDDDKLENLLKDLQERKKELNCLYKVEELLNNPQKPLEDLLQDVLDIIPTGWQYTELCMVRISYKKQVLETPGFEETPWMITEEIRIQEKKAGDVTVAYSHEVPHSQGRIFLEEERRLLRTIADRLSHTFLHYELKKTFTKWQGIREDFSHSKLEKWRAIMETLRRSDKKLFIYISRKMLRNLCLSGNEQANQLLKTFNMDQDEKRLSASDDNRPLIKQKMRHLLELSDRIFHLAAETMDEDQILFNIEKWIQEDKSKFLVKAIDNPNSSLHEIIDAITRYRYIEAEGIKLSSSIRKGLRVSLVRRFFYDQLEFINVAKKYIEVRDYYDIVSRIIFHADSRGSLGGKSAGLFLASRILGNFSSKYEVFRDIKVPKTWYIPSDGLINFLYYNDMEEVNEQKYKNIEEIRFEYPNLIQIFKNAQFPARITEGLKTAIEDIGDHPLIVRSSSLLEDRLGAAFSGKYKSLFLANRGSREERLERLKDAIAEIYASTFSPDPIEYRTEKGFLDFNEEMGIMIQEVVGSRVGPYFLPAFSGVAFSNNEFRWTPRIARNDGLIRMTLGLGTRVVDRVADDYPVLVAPGKPELRVNTTMEEILRYAPRRADVINLETNEFETVDVMDLVRRYGPEIPMGHDLFSKVSDGIIETPASAFFVNYEKDDLVLTFEGLYRKTAFIQEIRTMLEVLQEVLKTPVDIEFAHDGRHLNLLQCRPQSFSEESAPQDIPHDIPRQDILFSADRHVSNGDVPDIRYIVYVDPEGYRKLSKRSDLLNVGKVVGWLNQILPRREFILMGPGRWGSRGDIKLGVSVTYSEINNTAMLLEIAGKKGNFTPELSFGTHFFQDLVEASIRYLPLYPDENESVFNREFLVKAENRLAHLCGDFSYLQDVVYVIHVPAAARGRILRVVLNADQGRALGYFAAPR